MWRDRLSSSIELLQFQPVTAARRQMALAEICHDIESLCVSKNVCKIMRPFFTWPRERLRSIVMSMSVCPRGYLRNHTRDLYRILCMLPMPMSVARSSSGTLMIGRIGGDGSAQRGRSIIYDCLVSIWYHLCVDPHPSPMATPRRLSLS